MKLLSLVAFIVVGASASAATCPDLRGTYSCPTQDGGTETLTIDQTEADGVTSYIVNGETIPANGAPMSLPDDEYMKNQVVTFSCAGEPSQFVINFTGDYYEGATLVGKIVSDSFWSKDSSGALISQNNGLFTAVDGTQEPWSEQYACTPAN